MTVVFIEEQKPIELPCRSYTGHCLTQQEANALNVFLHDINRIANREVDTNSLAYREREFFLDQRHKLFVSIVSSN